MARDAKLENNQARVIEGLGGRDQIAVAVGFIAKYPPAGRKIPNCPPAGRRGGAGGYFFTVGWHPRVWLSEHSGDAT